MNKELLLNALNDKVKQCKKCQELSSGRTQTVFGDGNHDAKIVFCGEAPGKDEDEQGVPFVGRAGQLLNNIITACGLRRADCYILNICKCRPPKNRAPTPEEAGNCRSFLEMQLKIIGPQYIVCLGAVAAQNLLGITTPIGQLRGEFRELEIGDNKTQVLCTFHPAYLLRNPVAKKDVWDDLQLLVSKISQ